MRSGSRTNFLFRIFFVSSVFVVWYSHPQRRRSCNSQECAFANLPVLSESACTPRKLHLSQATDVDEDNDKVSMTLSFSVPFACRDLQAWIMYGEDEEDNDDDDDDKPSPTKIIAAMDPVQFNYSAPETMTTGIYQSDWIYHVVLDTLRGGQQRYAYTIIVLGDDGHGGSRGNNLPLLPPLQDPAKAVLRSNRKNNNLRKSPTYHFRTPPLADEPTSMALVGDLGQTVNSAKTIEHIRKATLRAQYGADTSVPVSQLLIAGDMSYADQDPYRWDSWLELIEPLARETSMQVAAGNHEIECDAQNNIFVPYEHWFRVPNRVGPAQSQPVSKAYQATLWNGRCGAPSEFVGTYDYGNSFYAYHHGMAKIVVLNSYTNSTPGSPQYTWLVQELQQHNRARFPWLIVVFHAPLYTTFLGHVEEREAVSMRISMEALYRKAGVNLIINGHDHAYMRTRSLYNGTVDATLQSPVYLTLGTGGNREQHSRGFRNATQEDWVAVRSLMDYGYGHLFLANATHAHLHWLRDGTTDFAIEDAVWFENPHVVKK